MRRFEATFSTSAWPSPRWVTGRAFVVATRTAAAARAITSRAKPASKISRLIPLLGQQTVGREITDRGVVLVQRVDRDPLRNGAGGRGQGSTELDLPVVGDPDPVDGAKHDRPLRPDQDDPPAAQRMSHPLGRVIGERAADRRRGVDREHADLQGLGGS